MPETFQPFRAKKQINVIDIKQTTKVFMQTFINVEANNIYK